MLGGAGQFLLPRNNRTVQCLMQFIDAPILQDINPISCRDPPVPIATCKILIERRRHQNSFREAWRKLWDRGQWLKVLKGNFPYKHFMQPRSKSRFRKMPQVMVNPTLLTINITIIPSFDIKLLLTSEPIFTHYFSIAFYKIPWKTRKSDKR